MLTVKDITLDRVKVARKLMADIIHQTPLDYSRIFSCLTGTNLHLKLENLQKTGSFKIRGAYNKVIGLSIEEKTRGVIAASAGNHAQGVAYAASRIGIKATIVMPEGSPISKVMATRGYGAEVILSGKNYDESYEKASQVQKKTGSTYIHGFDDPEVIAGQGTLGLEILEQLPQVDAVIVPLGGGGLLAGVSFAIKSIKPKVKVYGVQSAAAPAVYLWLKSGKYEELPPSSTIAEGINVRHPGGITTEIISKHVDDIVLVDDEEISQTILMLLERNKVVSEGAGAVGLAAMLHGKLELDGLNVAVIVSGGNIDVDVLSLIIERGLVKSGRRLRIKTVIADSPGSLHKIVTLVASQQVNIISIIHDRTRLKVPIRDAELEFVLETINWEHVESVIRAIITAGYSIEIL